MKKISNTVVDAIGNTPIVRLHSVSSGLEPTIYVKLEACNPGGSIKDRIAPFLIGDAEKEGTLKPGGTIVEATSGNTAIGLAMAAISARKGYKVVAVMSDKQSIDKVNTLHALGVKTVVTPSSVPPDHPESYYSVAERIVKETPNAILTNQYHNGANPRAHYETTGPEIWEQMEGNIQYFVAGLGTGGTISGVSHFLKEKNKSIQTIGVDPKGSILRQYHETKTVGEAGSYLIEGIGEDIIPKNVHFDYIDTMVTVDDQESITYLHRLAKEEGIFGGSSSGAAIAGAVKIARTLPKGNMLVILPDGGGKYLSKFYNSKWLRDNGLDPKDGKP